MDQPGLCACFTDDFVLIDNTTGKAYASGVGMPDITKPKSAENVPPVEMDCKKKR